MLAVFFWLQWKWEEKVRYSRNCRYFIVKRKLQNKLYFLVRVKNKSF